MDRVIGVLSSSEVTAKPEILFYYGVFAVLVTILVNWALATLLVMLKPFTCAAILLAFARPDLVQNFMQEEYLKVFEDKMKILFRGFLGLLLRLGEQFRSKVN